MVKLLKEKEILDMVRTFAKAVIVDIGEDGRNVNYWLKAKGKKINFFACLEGEVEVPIVDGIYVKKLESLVSWHREAIIICLEQNNDREVEDIQKLGFENIVCIKKEFLESLKQESVHEKNDMSFETNIFELKKCRYTNNEKKDVLLLIPPAWDVYTVPAALPCLTGALLQDNITVEQLDLGILCFHNKLKNNKWQDYAEALKSQLYYENTVKLYEANPYKSYEEYKNALWFFEEENFPIEMVKERYNALNRVQIGVLDVFYQNIASSLSINIDFFLEKKFKNVIEQYNKNILLDTIVEMDVKEKIFDAPSIVGISLTGTHQFVPGCVLAQIIREFNPNTKIIVGGSAIDIFWGSPYPNKNELLEYFDYAIIGEGETAIRKLVQNIIKSEDFDYDEVPNLVKWDVEGNAILPEVFIEDVNTLPVPCFDGVDLELYLAPQQMIPYQASRGCFYGQCAFCNHNTKYRHNYRTKDVKKVVEELLYIKKKYGVRYFQFIDEAIRTDYFEEMIEEMDKGDGFRDTKWLYYSRVSFQYKKELLEKAKRNGCEMVMFGVETFNQRLLNFIKKGINVEASKYCIKLFSEAGIKTFIWLMCNLPSESIEEMRQDIVDIKEHVKYLAGMAMGPFKLDVNTDMYKNMEKYNITRYNPYDATRFESTNNGEVIDKDAMFEVYSNEYAILQKEYFFTTNRYTVFYNNII